MFELHIVEDSSLFMIGSARSLLLFHYREILQVASYTPDKASPRVETDILRVDQPSAQRMLVALLSTQT